MSDTTTTQAGMRTWGREVVGRKASMLRSDGKWWTVRILSYDQNEKIHLLDIEPGKQVWYDICHPLRRIRWFNEHGILLPEGAQPEDSQAEKKRTQMYRRKTFPYIEIIISDAPDITDPIVPHADIPLDFDKIFIDSKDNAFVLDKQGKKRIPIYLPWSQAKRKRQAPLRPPDGAWDKIQRLCVSVGDNPLIYRRVRFYSSAEQSWVEGRVMYTRVNALGETQYWVHFDNGSTKWYDINPRDCRILDEYGEDQVGKFIVVQWMINVANKNTTPGASQRSPLTERGSSGQVARRWFLAKVMGYAPLLNMHHIRYISDVTSRTEPISVPLPRGAQSRENTRQQAVSMQSVSGERTDQPNLTDASLGSSGHLRNDASPIEEGLLPVPCSDTPQEYFAFRPPLRSLDEFACLHSRPHIWVDLASNMSIGNRFLGRRLHYYDPDTFSVNAGTITNFVLPPCIYKPHSTTATTTAAGEPTSAELEKDSYTALSKADNVHAEGQSTKRVTASEIIRNSIVCGLGLLPVVSPPGTPSYITNGSTKEGTNATITGPGQSVREKGDERKADASAYHTHSMDDTQRSQQSAETVSSVVQQTKGESTESIHANRLRRTEETADHSIGVNMGVLRNNPHSDQQDVQSEAENRDKESPGFYRSKRALDDTNVAIRKVVLHPLKVKDSCISYSILEDNDTAVSSCSLQCARVTIVLDQGGIKKDIPLYKLFIRWGTDKVTAEGFTHVDGNNVQSIQSKNNDALSMVVNDVEHWSDEQKLSFWRDRVRKFPFPSYPLIPSGVGLINTGNLCWLSSVLQCLARVDPLVEYLGAGPNRSLFRRLNVDNVIGFGGRLATALSEIFFLLRRQEALNYLQLQCNKVRIVCEVGNEGMGSDDVGVEALKDNPFWDEIRQDPILTFADQITVPNTSIHSSLVPCFVKSLLSEQVATFDGLLQQDAHEGLIILLNGLHEDLKESTDTVVNRRGPLSARRMDSQGSMEASSSKYLSNSRKHSFLRSFRIHSMSANDPDSRTIGELSNENIASESDTAPDMGRGASQSEASASRDRLLSDATPPQQSRVCNDNLEADADRTNQHGAAATDLKTMDPSGMSQTSQEKQSGRHSRKGIWTFLFRSKKKGSTSYGSSQRKDELEQGILENISASASSALLPETNEKPVSTNESHPNVSSEGMAREARKSVRSMDLRSLHTARSSGLSREIIPSNIKPDHSFVKQLFFIRTAYEFICSRNSKHRTIHFGPSEGEFLPPTPIVDSRKLRSTWLGGKRPNSPADLTDFIDLAFSAETVEKTCEECGKRSSMQLQPWLLCLSPIIILQLKRFQFDPVTNTHSKVQFPVKFPLEGLSLDKYLLSEDSNSLTAKDRQQLRDIRRQSFMFNRSFQQQHYKGKKGTSWEKSAKYPAVEQETTYNLFGVICHSGMIERGHYTAFSRPSGPLHGDFAFPFTKQSLPSAHQKPKHFGAWQYFDDSYVLPVSDEEMQSEKIQEQVYLLFYMRQSS